MDALRLDLKHALRALLRTPGFTLAAVLTLAFGVGANTAMFSVADRMLGPLPYRDAARLTTFVREDPRQVPSEVPFSAPVFLDYQREMTQAEAMTAIGFDRYTLSGEGDAQQILITRVTEPFFRVAGFHPRLGTAFNVEDDREGAPGTMILNHGFWQRRFGGDPNIVGRTLRLNGQDVRVVGVMGPDFDLFEQVVGLAPEVFVPMAFSRDDLNGRYSRSFQVLMRLKPGSSPTAATADARRVHASLNEREPGNPDKDYLPRVAPVKEAVNKFIQPAILALMVVVGFILLIACANLSNLLLARGLARQRELTICAALGADRSRLIARLLAEGVLLGLAGALGALLVGALLLRVLGNLLSSINLGGVNVAVAFGLNLRVTLFTFALMAFALVIFSLLPAWRVSRIEVSSVLKEGAKGSAGPGQTRLRSALVVIEVALSMMLLVGAGLMLRSLQKLSGLQPGFETQNLLMVRVSPIPLKYPTPESRAAFARLLLERTAALPGVRATTLTDAPPLQNGGSDQSYVLDGITPPENGYTNALYHRVAPNYFATLGIPMRQGRTFEGFDEVGCVVNETFARNHWPSGDALGRIVRLGGRNGVRYPIVGIVPDTQQEAIGGKVRTQLYVPSSRLMVGSSTTLCVRTTLTPTSVLPALRQLLRDLDPDLPLAAPQTGEETLRSSLRLPTTLGILFAAFGGLGLLLAAFGLYGLMSFVVGQRTKEIGIRMALGGRPGTVVGDVTRHGLLLTALGIGIGVLASVGLGQMLASQLYGVGSADPLAMALSALVLLTVALAATLLPALRASRVAPMVALRDE